MVPGATTKLLVVKRSFKESSSSRTAFSRIVLSRILGKGKRSIQGMCSVVICNSVGRSVVEMS